MSGDGAQTVTLRANEVNCPNIASDPRAAIEEWLERFEAIPFAYLLAWSSDGVTWGRVESTAGSRRLVTSERLIPAASPGLTATLTECRLFTNDVPAAHGIGAEVHAWKGGAGWRAVLVSDEKAASGMSGVVIRDTHQVLFGTSAETAANGFTVVREGQGLRHAPPIEFPLREYADGYRPIRLHVREYLEVVSGVTRVGLSRLGGLSVEKEARS